MVEVKAYLGVARAPFLLLSVTLVAAGAAAGYYAGDFSWLRTLIALLGLVALHASVDAFNEVSDMRTGIDLQTRRTPFSGGSGTLPAGLISSRAALMFAFATASIGLAAGIYFLIEVGIVFLPIFILGAACVLLYADVLSRSGVGEIAAGLGLGLLPVVGAAVVQGGRYPAAAVAAGVPAFLMTFNLLLLNEFPDETADHAGGRKNIVLMLGRRGAAYVYSAAAILTPLSIAAAVAAGLLPAVCLIAMVPSLFLVLPLRWAFGAAQDPVPVAALGTNVAWNLLTNVFMAAALAIA
ncbi:MAG: prenyltransferase [Acidobacteria bacterium]|nr:prenyltransferase [Acidobacteriota bacterium]